jgi:hypothetical protein
MEFAWSMGPPRYEMQSLAIQLCSIGILGCLMMRPKIAIYEEAEFKNKGNASYED